MRYKGKFVSANASKKLEHLKPRTKENAQVDLVEGPKENGKESSSEPGGYPDIRLTSWNEGRRIVELKLLADGLKSCNSCMKHLQLENCVDETVNGLGSILYIKCHECKTLNSVPTGKRHSASGDGPAKCFDVNSKLAAAMIHVGIGEQQINNILAELNLPGIHHKTLKEREREVGSAFEKVAQVSCDVAIQKDISFSGDNQVSCDGGWQRRGTGQNYDSLSGHVTVIGKHTKKCLGFGVAMKTCRVCKSKGKVIKPHKCRKNWTGSAKGMEPFLTVKCLREVQDKGLNISKVIMDDDTTTFRRVQKAISPSFRKASDKNHVVKNFCNALYNIRRNGKQISSKTICYFKKCFSYAIEQNKMNENGLKSSLEAIVPHAFGDHSKCNVKWCGFNKKGDKFIYKSLPFGKKLEGEELMKSLSEILEKQIINAGNLI